MKYAYLCCWQLWDDYSYTVLEVKSSQKAALAWLYAMQKEAKKLKVKCTLYIGEEDNPYGDFLETDKGIYCIKKQKISP